MTLIRISGFLYAQSWVQLPTIGTPPERANASSIYLQSENRMIVFGGRNSTGNLNDVWSLNLSTNEWNNITPASGSMPSVRFTANAVYDSLLNRMIIWSGQGSALYNDVWAFNFNNNSWQELWPDGNTAGAPLKRYGTAAIFDPNNRRLVNFAGFTTSGRFDDTWYFQVDSLRWTDQTNSNHPELRCLHSGYITPDRTQMIIYAGQHNGALADIWSLDLNSYVWTNLTPVIKPDGRWFSPVVNTNSNYSVIFGGQNSLSTFGDLWKFSIDSMKWDSVSQGVTKPSARWGHASVYIPSSDKLIIFSGADPEYKNDTWVFNNISSVRVNSISSVIPNTFTLYQNYPNPFNPVTKIKFDISTNAKSQSSDVKLFVFDVSGKEIQTLVDEKLKAGSYEVEFNGAGLASGVYFYMIETGEFFDTKKMLIIK
ncbi:MAG: T9SS type A sorting domain-containing protein [Ignavibacteria bacterium]|nr:T9SS type A sorting domain-containing protein [Ignavibacteria bacterium]